METGWNLDELAQRVDAALAVDYPGQPSGRVRAVPDRRAIRWYTTIGLIDRPLAYRGRTALYGPRHLLQLVAIKRLQAKGLPLVAIQQELAGATDTRLARVAQLPAAAAATPDPIAAPGGRPPRRGRTAAAGGPRPAGDFRPSGGGPRPAGGGPRAARRAGFWRQQPAAFLAAETATSDSLDPLADPGPGRTDPGGRDGSGLPDAAHAEDPAGGPNEPGIPTAAAAPERTGSGDPDHPGADGAGPGGVATLQGIRLGAGATLLLEPGRELDAADVGALLDAAGPLLAALRDLGLGGGVSSRTEPRREHP